MELGEGRNHVIRGGRVVNAVPPPPAPNHITSQLTEARNPTVTSTSKTVKPEKPSVTKAVAAQPLSTKLVVTPHPTTQPLEGIYDLLDQLPI
jgi:hypothetical protein